MIFDQLKIQRLKFAFLYPLSLSLYPLKKGERLPE
jgi:hypothetical protein